MIHWFLFFLSRLLLVVREQKQLHQDVVPHKAFLQLERFYFCSNWFLGNMVPNASTWILLSPIQHFSNWNGSIFAQIDFWGTWSKCLYLNIATVLCRSIPGSQTVWKLLHESNKIESSYSNLVVRHLRNYAQKSCINNILNFYLHWFSSGFLQRFLDALLLIRVRHLGT